MDYIFRFIYNRMYIEGTFFTRYNVSFYAYFD